MELRRQADAGLINRFLNDPSVYPWVSGGRPFPLDAGPVIAHPDHVVLCSDYGGIIFAKLAVGYYEAHTAVLPEKRGAGTLALGRAALEWMFCRTDAVEILTRVPAGNGAAEAAMRAMRIPVWFTTMPIWPTPAGRVSMSVYKLHLFDWITAASASLAGRGVEFHRRLVNGGGDLDHATDPVHDAYVGAAWGMIDGGQADKAVATYNLWAALSGYRPISIAHREPLLIDIGTGIIEVATGTFRARRVAA
jgi:hypothetical protein